MDSFRNFYFNIFIYLVCCILKFNCSEYGSTCYSNGVKGKCVNLYKCFSIAGSLTYRNTGFDVTNESYDICSLDGDEPIVCCTDCEIDELETWKTIAIGPAGLLKEKKGSVAWKKCLNYYEKLPYSCRNNKILFLKMWDNKNKCFNIKVNINLIANGRNANEMEFPHMAILGYGNNIHSLSWMCGGTVISEKYILTAAHCISSPDVGKVNYVALGVGNRSDIKRSNIYKVNKIITHPGYKSPLKYNDIALLRLHIRIKFSPKILPACLDTGADLDRSTAEAIGWGQLGYKEQPAETLQVVDLNQIGVNDWKKYYGSHRTLPDGLNKSTQMCYGSINKASGDTCKGDSGGPLQIHDRKCQYTVIGITSFGEDCQASNSGKMETRREVIVGVYTKVEYYLPWIEKIVWPGPDFFIYEDINKIGL